MSDENGVTTRTMSRLSLVQAIRSAPATRSRVLRRRRRADDVTLAGHILAFHDEAGPPVAAAQEITDGEFEAAKADLIARFGAVPPTLQRVMDRGGRFGLPVVTQLADTPVTTTLGDLGDRDEDIAREKRRADEAEQRLADLEAAQSAAIADVTERAARLEAEAAELRDGTASLLADTCKAEARAEIARTALVRLAGPGMNVTARRQVASDALAELDAAAAGEAVAADEPA